MGSEMCIRDRVDMMDVGSSMTSFVGSGSESETVIESSSGGFSRPTSPQG